MVRLKERHRHWGPRKLQELYLRQWGVGPSESSFKRVLERCGLTEKRRIRAAATTGRIASGRRASGPNEVWTVDFKGWWYDAQGKCNPLTVRDEYSRYLLEMRALADARTATVRSALSGSFASTECLGRSAATMARLWQPRPVGAFALECVVAGQRD